MTKLQVLLCSLFLASASISQSIDIFHEISKGNYKAVKSWVRSKPDVSIRDGQGQSIVHAAVVAGDIRTLRYVLSCKPDVNLVNNAGKTALDIAIDYGNEVIIFKLVCKKALVTTFKNERHLRFLLEEKAKKFTSHLNKLFGRIFPAILCFVAACVWVSLIDSSGLGTLALIVFVLPFGSIGYASYIISVAIKATSWCDRSLKCYLINPAIDC